MTPSRREVVGAGAAAGLLAASGAAAAPDRLGVGEADALDLARLVARRQVSAAELLEAAIARAEALNPRFDFMAQKLYDYGRGRLAAGLPEGPFTGVPWLIKDLHTDVAGQRTGQGSRFWDGYIATTTSELVRRHERAGLVVFGKTTCPELGLTATTESLATGKTRNPWNPERIAGGSSGGAAVAVAAGVVPAAHATDGGGSIRIPASCCGLFGLKPSRGRVPMGPERTEGWGGLSTHHAVTRSVRDSAALLDATCGVEPGSRYGAPGPARPYVEEASANPGRLRVALMLAPLAGTPVDPECLAAARAAAHLCERLGHHVEEAAPKLDAAALGRAAFSAMAPALAADIDDRAAATGHDVGPDVLEAVTLVFYGVGKRMTAEEVARGNNAMQAAAWEVARFMRAYDVILSPTLAAPPLPLGVIDLSETDFARWGKQVSEFTPFTGLYNYTGAPAMSVPLGVSAEGLPIGVMFAGRYGDEATLFRLAGQLERAAPWTGRRPKAA